MLKSIKINTAILIFSAFIFRLLFVNIGIISSLNTEKNNSFIKAYFSTIMKRSRHFEVLNNSINYEYSAVEICEEDSNDENQFKSNPFFYSIVANKTKNKLKKSYLSNKYFSYTSSYRYLIFHVFRV